MLVAISIPIFTGQLEKSKEATDEANLRAAYSEGVSDLLLEKIEDQDIDYTKTYYYNTFTGKIDEKGNAAGKGTSTIVSKDGSGKASYPDFTGTEANGGMSYNGGDVKGHKIEVHFKQGDGDKSGSVFVQFSAS